MYIFQEPLMSTHKLCFYGELTKFFLQLSSNTKLLVLYFFSALFQSTSSATYDEISVEEQYPHHRQYPPNHQSPLHHPQSPHHPQNHQIPQHATNGSPKMRTKFANEPPSPSAVGQRPFSYGANIMSPKLKHVDTNGQSRQSSNVPGNQSEQVVRYDETSSASPALSYGKHESAFSPQPKRPAPTGPPPPAPPPSGYHQAPPLQPHTGRAGLPNLRMQQRHSVTTLEEGANNKLKSPVSSAQRERFSKRSKSMPCNPEDEVNLPSPPPPVSVKDSYLAVAVATNRPPSPPLPPPPPEMMLPSRDQPPPPPTNVPYNQNQISYSQQQQYIQQQQFNQQQQYNQQHFQYGGQSVSQVHSGFPGTGSQPPPPPPVSSIPKKSNEQGTSVTPIGGNSVSPSQFKGANSVLPSNKDVGRAKRDQSPGMLDELSRVQLKRTGNSLSFTLSFVT